MGAKVSLDIFLKAHDELSATFKALETRLEGSRKGVDDFNRAYKNTFDLSRSSGTALSATGIALLGVATSGAKAAMDMEGYRAKLGVAIKDTERATATFEWAKETAAKTPFEMPGVVDATARLEMYGLSAQKWFPLVGDMAGAMGKDVTQGVEAIADAVSGGGLERLKEFGVSGEQLKQLGWSGDYSAKGIETLKAALSDLLASRFGGGMEQMMGTAKGALSNFSDGVFQVRAAIGDALLPIIKEVTPTLVELAKGLSDLANTDAGQGLIKIGAGAGVAMLALGPLLLALPTIVTQLKALPGAATEAGRALGSGLSVGAMAALAGIAAIIDALDLLGTRKKALEDIDKRSSDATLRIKELRAEQRTDTSPATRMKRELDIVDAQLKDLEDQKKRMQEETGAGSLNPLRGMHTPETWRKYREEYSIIEESTQRLTARQKELKDALGKTYDAVGTEAAPATAELSKEQETAADAAQKLADAEKASGEAIEAAKERVAQATEREQQVREDNAQRIQDAADNVAEAEETLADTVESAGERRQDAAQRVADAKDAQAEQEKASARSIKDAVDAVAEAEKAAAKNAEDSAQRVGDARDKAREAGEKYAEAVKKQGDTQVEQAGLVRDAELKALDDVAKARDKANKDLASAQKRLADAEQNQRDVFMEPYIKRLPKAVQEYMARRRSLMEAQGKVNEARAAVRDAASTGPAEIARAEAKAADDVDKAKKRQKDANDGAMKAVGDARDAWTKATDDIRKAEGEQADAAEKARERVENAKQAETDARDNAAKAAERASRAVQDALDAQVKADRSAAKAVEDARDRVNKARQDQVKVAQKAAQDQQKAADDIGKAQTALAKVTETETKKQVKAAEDLVKASEKLTTAKFAEALTSVGLANAENQRTAPDKFKAQIESFTNLAMLFSNAYAGQRLWRSIGGNPLAGLTGGGTGSGQQATTSAPLTGWTPAQIQEWRKQQSVYLTTPGQEQRNRGPIMGTSGGRDMTVTHKFQDGVVAVQADQLVNRTMEQTVRGGQNMAVPGLEPAPAY